ncbi:MAG: hypothetical protein KDA71_02400, partial [Planctomycetales bacterium]|nr:hypothetical protein [Planctomycetales bacterium]
GLPLGELTVRLAASLDERPEMYDTEACPPRTVVLERGRTTPLKLDCWDHLLKPLKLGRTAKVIRFLGLLRSSESSLPCSGGVAKLATAEP